MLGHLAARIVAGLEHVEDGVYYRSVAIDGAQGSIAVAHLPERNSIAVTIRFPSIRALPAMPACSRGEHSPAATLAPVAPNVLAGGDYQ